MNAAPDAAVDVVDADVELQAVESQATEHPASAPPPERPAPAATPDRAAASAPVDVQTAAPAPATPTPAAPTVDGASPPESGSPRTEVAASRPQAPAPSAPAPATSAEGAPADDASTGDGNEPARAFEPRPADAGSTRTPGPAPATPTGGEATSGAPQRATASPDATPPTAEAPRPDPGARAADLERAAQVFEQVRVHLRPESHRATLELLPPALGRVAVSIDVREGRLRATLRAERPEALAALERHVPELRAALSSSGLETEEIRLELAADPDGHDARTGHGRDRREDAPARSASRAGAADALERRIPTRAAHLLMPQGGVDTYA